MPIRVAASEILKLRRKQTKVSVLMFITALLVASASVLYTAKTGYESDIAIYRSNVKLSREFEVYSTPDVYIYGRAVLLTAQSDRSVAAADEARAAMEAEYLKTLEKYGKKAFPILVSVEYVERSSSPPTLRRAQQIQQPGISNATRPTPTGTPEQSEIPVEIPAEGRIANASEFLVPEELSPPSLVEKMVLVMLFLIPSYFLAQLYSSSLIEDKFSRRLEVLLSIFDGREIIAGKLLPYLIAAMIAMSLEAVLLNVGLAFLLAVPIVLLLMSFHSAIAMASRSYRESTFLLLIASLLVTIYAAIPAVFQLPVLSSLSPLASMLRIIESGKLTAEDLAVQGYTMASMCAVLLYSAARMCSPDVAYGDSVIEKLAAVAKGSDAKALGAGFLSVPFALFAEFFLIVILFIAPPKLSLPIIVLCVAIVEEFAKGIIVAANHRISAAIFVALGFFLGEKFLLFLTPAREYVTTYAARFLFLPLTLHVAAAIVFLTLFRRYGFPAAIAAAISLHFAYNYAVVTLLAGSGI